MDSKKTRKRILLAAIAVLVLSTIRSMAVLAQNCQVSREGSATIDNQIQLGKYVIPSCFFGMHIDKVTTPWPVPYFADLRLHDSGVAWLGIAQAYWYQWDNNVGIGTLWQGPSSVVSNNWRLAGYAYNSIVNWTMGATLTNACELQKGSTSVWTCRYSRSSPSNYTAQIVWNADEGSTYKVAQEFSQYCDLKGNVTQVTNNKVQVGIWPILLENENLGQTACQQ